jgi:preprotein translocase subunit SecD
VISAPVVAGDLGGSGRFAVSRSERQRTRDPCCRAALPAKLTPINNAVGGPGSDKIDPKGKLASRRRLVVVFMFATTGCSACSPSKAVAVNVAMIFRVLAVERDLVPGIAGIVLTVGIAVDSNVLIYERIREEVRGGRSAISAIDAGFSRALATILDSNITTFIAAAVLFVIGTGPVRGFAVTLGIGIATSLFTAFTLTRLIVATWVQWQRPKTVPI